MMKGGSFASVRSIDYAEERLWDTNCKEFFERLEKEARILNHDKEVEFIEKVRTIFHDEEDYCMSLRFVIEEYLDPLCKARRLYTCMEVADEYTNKCVHNKNPLKCKEPSWEDTAIVEPEDIEQIFEGIRDVYNVNLLFFRHIKKNISKITSDKTKAATSNIEDVVQIYAKGFNKIDKHLRPYFAYCYQFSHAKDKLEELRENNVHFANFLKEHTPKDPKLSLDHLLLKPVYRLSYYAETFAKLVAASRPYIQARVSYAQKSDSYSIDYEKLMKLMDNLEKIKKTMASVSNKAKDNVEFWSSFQQTENVYAELLDDDLNPNVHVERRFLFKFSDVKVFDKKKDPENDLFEKLALYVYNDLLVFVRVEELDSSELNSSFGKRKSGVSERSRRSGTFRERLVSTASEHLNKSMKSFRKRLKSTASRPRNLFSMSVRRKSNISVGSNLSNSETLLLSELKDKNMIAKFPVHMNSYKIVFKFEIDSTAIKPVKNHLFGFKAGFSLWYRYRDVPNFGANDSTSSQISRLSNQNYNSSTNSIKRKNGRYLLQKANAQPTLTAVEPIIIDNESDNELDQSESRISNYKIRRGQINSINAKKKLNLHNLENLNSLVLNNTNNANSSGSQLPKSSQGGSGASADPLLKQAASRTLKQKGLELLFDNEEECEKVLNAITEQKTSRDKLFGKTDTSAASTNSKKSMRKWAKKRSERRDSVMSEGPNKSDETIVPQKKTDSVRKTRVQSTASMYSIEFEPVYVKDI